MAQQTLPQFNQLITAQGNQQIFKTLGNFAFQDNNLLLSYNQTTRIFQFRGNIVWNGILYQAINEIITLNVISSGYLYLYNRNGKLYLEIGTTPTPSNPDWAVLGNINNNTFTQIIETVNYDLNSRVNVLEEDTGWINVTPMPGYISTLTYRVKNNVIYFKGEIRVSTGYLQNGHNIAQVPNNLYQGDRIAVAAGLGTTFIKLIFRNEGFIESYVSGNTTYVNLDNISFLLE